MNRNTLIKKLNTQEITTGDARFLWYTLTKFMTLENALSVGCDIMERANHTCHVLFRI